MPLRMAGQYADEEVGLFYNYFRFYNPETGRYIENDPIDLQGGLNRYGYVSGNPLHSVDPYGLEKVNLFDPIKEKTMYKISENHDSPKGFCSVYAHGDIGIISSTTSKDDIIAIPDIVNHINKNCPINQPVQLYSCDGGENSIAQKIANKSKRTVYGYDQNVIYAIPNKIFVIPIITDNNKFTPK